MMLSDVLTSVAYIGPKSRTERHRKTKFGIEVAHVTCDWDTTFKVKRSKVKVTSPLLLNAALTLKAAAAVSVGTCSAWVSTATLRLLGAARALGPHRGGERRGHIVSPRAQLVRR